MEDKLYLITERNPDTGHEVNFLRMSSELFGRRGFLPPVEELEQGREGSWDYLRYQTKIFAHEEFRLHAIDLDGNISAATQDIAAFLSGDHNKGATSWENDPMRSSPDAKKALAGLMQPVLAADLDGKYWKHDRTAGEWVDRHQDFIADLDKVFSSLDILRIERLRGSVTQGAVDVFCNGEKVVCFGDDMWLQRKDGMIENAMSGQIKPGPLYGPVISGWGSPTPDEQFRKGAIIQYCNSVHRYLQQDPIRQIEIWQLNPDKEEGVRARFLNYESNLRINGTFKPELYEKVWAGKLQAKNLEDIYYIFNQAHPEDYKAPSLSVSDVVKADSNYYFCDSIGFRKIEFEPKAPSLDARLQEAKTASQNLAQSQSDLTRENNDRSI